MVVFRSFSKLGLVTIIALLFYALWTWTHTLNVAARANGMLGLSTAKIKAELQFVRKRNKLGLTRCLLLDLTKLQTLQNTNAASVCVRVWFPVFFWRRRNVCVCVGFHVCVFVGWRIKGFYYYCYHHIILRLCKCLVEHIASEDKFCWFRCLSGRRSLEIKLVEDGCKP